MSKVTQRTISLLAVTLLLVAARVSHTQAPRLLPPQKPLTGPPSSWIEDATLRDICFVDLDHGWAVGDLGVIWHTTTGGASWRRQVSPVECQLSSVHFVDRDHGFAAGGFCYPLTHRSEGVFLRTLDGGSTWEQVPGLLIPWLTSIEFRSTQTGMAVGLATTMNPSGAFTTQDGGRTWTPLLGTSGTHWSTASYSKEAALLVGFSGERSWRRGDRLTQVDRQTDTLSVSSLSGLVDSGIGFSGFGNSLALSVDSGNQWAHIETPNLASMHTIATSDAVCWIAGSPGSRVLLSQDHARSWQSVPTGFTLPVHQLHFQNQKRGWMAGAMGMINTTDDGGATWKPQRGSGKRAALLVVAATEKDIPWQLLTRASAADAFRTHIVVLCESVSDPLACPLRLRLADASMRIGASSEVLTQLHLSDVDPNASALLSIWEKEHPGIAEHLSEKLCALIRTWRPDVIVTPVPTDTPASHSGIHAVSSQLVSNACEFAASELSFPQQLEMGLVPWPVSRPLGIQPTKQPASVADNSQIATLGGQTINELARETQRLVTSSETSLHAWSIVYLEAHKSAQKSSLGMNPMSGLPSQYATAERRARGISTDDIAHQKRLRQRRKHARGLLLSAFTDNAGRVEQADRLLADLDDDFAAEVFFEMSQGAIDDAKFQLAVEGFEKLIERYPDHPLSDPAIHWLMAYHASREMRWRKERDVRVPDVQLASAEQVAGTSQTAGATVTTTTTSNESQEAIKLAQQLKSKRPAVYSQPQVALGVAAATRDTGHVQQVSSIYHRLMSLPLDSAWRRRAATELALLEPTAAPRGNTTWVCRRTSDRPTLDGDLTDECWKHAVSQNLKSEHESDPVTVVYLAHDDEHIYVAAECEKRDGATYLPSRRPRPRDAELENLDRIEFEIDINRDYSSSWSFTIDHRGWTAESVMGDQNWNPEYFVASTDDTSRWNIELAIPLDEISPPTHRAGTVWAMSVRRVIPQDRIQSWSPLDGADTSRAGEGVVLIE